MGVGPAESRAGNSSACGVFPELCDKEPEGRVPLWLEAVLVYAVALVAAWGAARLIYRLGLKSLSWADEFWRELLIRTRGPVQLGLMILALALATDALDLTGRETRFIQSLLTIAFIGCLSWVMKVALDIWIALHLKRYRIDVEDNLLARKHITQSRILQRVGTVLIFVVGFATALMMIDGVRQYGVSLLASAGAAGLIIGLALQPVLRNLIAGIQIALTQPIRVDDAVIVEGEWGNIEEITATYVVVRIWDRRRLVVPLHHFLDQPFQNWTRRDAALIGSVMLYLDHEVSIPDLRREAERVVKASPLWDGEVFVLQVTDFTENQVEVRILASASHAGKAFDLRCHVREALLAYLQAEQPWALPKTRADVVSMPGAGQAGGEMLKPRTAPATAPDEAGPQPALSDLVDQKTEDPQRGAPRTPKRLIRKELGEIRGL